MQLGKTVADFVANPFDPNGDGKTSLVELAAALGLVALLSFFWSNVIKSMTGED